MSDFFSGSKPDLISLKSINDLAIIANASPAKIVPIQIKKSWDPKSIYYSYIKPNIVPIILILLFIVALLIRYFMINDTDAEINKKEQFNPAESVFEQPNHNVYVGGDSVIYDLEDNIDENELMEKITKKTQVPFDPKIRSTRGVYPHVTEDTVREVKIEEPDDDDRQIIYKGRDDWLNQFDGYENPFFGNNMVTSTGSAVQFGLEQNQKSVDLDKMAKQMFG